MHRAITSYHAKNDFYCFPNSMFKYRDPKRFPQLEVDGMIYLVTCLSQEPRRKGSLLACYYFQLKYYSRIQFSLVPDLSWSRHTYASPIAVL